jgi:hypothetical protein
MTCRKLKYRASIALDRNPTDAPRLLGLALHARGRIDEASEVCLQLLAPERSLLSASALAFSGP